MKGKRILSRIAQAADLGLEPILGKTLIELLDRESALIENHCGVISYCSERIVVRSNVGNISISGCNMSIWEMNTEQLIIRGDIHCVSFNGSL